MAGPRLLGLAWLQVDNQLRKIAHGDYGWKDTREDMGIRLREIGLRPWRLRTSARRS